MSGPVVLGLTGSIASGKSYLARLVAGHGVPVFDSDAEVHALMAPGGPAVAPIAEAFPGTVDENGRLDRRALGARVFGDDAALDRLEALIHPLVRRRQKAFLEACSRARMRLALLDVPLLFETGADALVDLVLVADVHPDLQRQRALARPGMTEARLQAVLARQMPAADKRRRADIVINSGHDRGAAAAAIASALRHALGLAPAAWPARWLGGFSPSTARGSRVHA